MSLSDIEKRLSSKGIKNICVNKKEKIYVYVISKNLKKSIDNRVIAKKIKINF